MLADGLDKAGKRVHYSNMFGNLFKNLKLSEKKIFN